MRKSFAAVLVCLAVLFASAAFAADTYSLKVSSNHAEGHITLKALYVFAEELDKVSGGKVKLQVYPAAQLGEETEVIEQCRQGSIDFVRVSAGNMSPFSPIMDIFSVPYLFNDADHYMKILKGDIGQKIFKGLEEKGMKGVVYYDGGARSFYNKVRPIVVPADLKGLKIRVMPSKIMLGFIETLGAVATNTSFSEVYSALHTGVIDGAENAAINLLTMNHYEVAKYFSLDEHMRIPDMLVVSLQKWKSFPPEVQEFITKAAKASQDWQMNAWGEADRKTIETLKEKNTQINNNVEKKKFQEALKGYIDGLKPQFGGLIEEIQAVK